MDTREFRNGSSVLDIPLTTISTRPYDVTDFATWDERGVRNAIGALLGYRVLPRIDAVIRLDLLDPDTNYLGHQLGLLSSDDVIQIALRRTSSGLHLRSAEEQLAFSLSSEADELITDELPLRSSISPMSARIWLYFVLNSWGREHEVSALEFRDFLASWCSQLPADPWSELVSVRGDRRFRERFAKIHARETLDLALEAPAM